MVRKYRRGDTPHDQTALAVASDINLAILDGRPYRTRITCATEDCNYPGYFDIAFLGGVALVEQHIPEPRMRPDIVVKVNDDVMTIVEIVDTSAPSVEKRMKLVRFGVPTLLLDILEPAVSADGFTTSDSINVDALCYVCNLLKNAPEPSVEAIERAMNWKVTSEPSTDGSGTVVEETQEATPVTSDAGTRHVPITPPDAWQMLPESHPFVLNRTQLTRLDRLLVLTSAE